METYRSRFYKNPSVDPKTGEQIDINSKRFKQLVKKYGDVRIVSPKSGREITVGKATYNKLLKEGYSVNELLNINNKELNIKNITTRDLMKDEMYAIMINADYETIKHLCLTNKTGADICNDEFFWKTKLNMDYPDIDVVSNWKKEYYKLNKAYKDVEKTIEIFYEEAKDLDDDTEVIMLMYLDKSVDIESIIPKYKKNIDEMLMDPDNKNYINYVLLIGMNKNNIINLTMLIEDIDGDQLDSFDETINIKDLMDILFKVLYYYPEINIEDIDEFSYLLKPLQDTIKNLMGKPMHPKKFKQIGKRLTFLKQLENQ